MLEFIETFMHIEVLCPQNRLECEEFQPLLVTVRPFRNSVPIPFPRMLRATYSAQTYLLSRIIKPRIASFSNTCAQLWSIMLSAELISDAREWKCGIHFVVSPNSALRHWYQAVVRGVLSPKAKRTW